LRLDSYLVKEGYFESRNRATNAIKDGLILVDGVIAKKASIKVENSKVEVKEHKFYVSRAAKKLEEYLKESPINLSNKRALDIGSSTGGFTQVLLEHGVSSVDCVDVGSKQLHQTLRDNPKVNVFENCDIREFKSSPYELIVSDVSFISLIKVLPYIDNLSLKESIIILLFKPQFEVGKDVKRDRNGVVIDKIAIDKAKENFLIESKKYNLKLIDSRVSKVKGKEGNEEFIYRFVKE